MKAFWNFWNCRQFTLHDIRTTIKSSECRSLRRTGVFILSQYSSASAANVFCICRVFCQVCIKLRHWRETWLYFVWANELRAWCFSTGTLTSAKGIFVYFHVLDIIQVNMYRDFNIYEECFLRNLHANLNAGVFLKTWNWYFYWPTLSDTFVKVWALYSNRTGTWELLHLSVAQKGRGRHV